LIRTPEAEWLHPLIEWMQRAQEGLLGLLASIGLAGTSHGQPAWPWALRLSGENLLVDAGQAQRAALTLLVLAIAALAVLLAGLWRKPRWYLIAAVPLLVVAAPWPEPRVLFVPALPTSFHRSPTGFGAASIARGGELYAQHCVACHGTDGRGQGPLAATQPVWPPDLAGPLLWRRADGDLLWHLLHGMKDRHGAATMPAFAQLGDGDAWALIDFLKAQAAGQGLRATGAWTGPVGLPDVEVRCEGRAPRPLASWRGQRLRIVAVGQPDAALREDPRVVTVLLRREDDTAPGPQAECIAASTAAWTAFSLIAGTDQLAGTQWLADRDGWLRALGSPERAGWSEDDLLCRTDARDRGAPPLPPGAGLGALIARMDAEPVRFLKGGFVAH